MPRISFLGMMAAAKVVPVRAYCTAAATTGRELMVIEPKARKWSFLRRRLGFSLVGVGGLLISYYSTNIQALAHRLNVNQSVKEEASAAKAEARAEKAEARAERAEARAERAEARADRDEKRADRDEARAEARAEKADARADRDEKRADRDEARADRAETRAVEAAAAAQQGWFSWGKKKKNKEN